MLLDVPLVVPVPVPAAAVMSSNKGRLGGEGILFLPLLAITLTITKFLNTLLEERRFVWELRVLL